MAKEIKSLREKGVLIIGSGNMVHNLRMVAWKQLNENFGFDWAIEANEQMKKHILIRDHQQLINFRSLGKAFDLVKDEKDQVRLFNDQAVAGSLTMTSVKIG